MKSDNDPVLLLNSWLRGRAENQNYTINLVDLPNLASDMNVIPSGVSDSRSGISSQDFFEGYVLKKDLA